MPGFMEFSNDLGIYYHKWCQFIKKNFKNYAIFKVHVDFNRSYRFYFYNSRFLFCGMIFISNNTFKTGKNTT